MTSPDNRGLTRLDGALSVWRRVEAAAGATFSKIEYFSFAADLRPAASLDEALARNGNTGQTRLYASLASILRVSPGERPDAVVAMTDGLDTSNASASELLDAARSAQVPVYFVPGSNRSLPEPFLRVREWRAPAIAIRNTDFTIDLSFEAFSLADHAVPISLWEDGKRVDGGLLSLTLGSNLIPWHFHVASGEPGMRDFILRFGESVEAPIAARSITRVEERHPVRVLVYQGALDWGFRTLADALRTDPDFKLTALFAAPSKIEAATTTLAGARWLQEHNLTNLSNGSKPAIPDRGTSDSPPSIEGRFAADLPDNVSGYRNFDCVILARTYPQKLAGNQEQALVEFVRGGGSAIFVNSDPAANESFRASGIKELLPVVFAEIDATPSAASDGTVLQPFTLTEAGRISPIFSAAGGGLILPRFVLSDTTSRAKPGSEVLAVDPRPRDAANGQPGILLATQTVGRGHTAFLATDELWKWKFSEPSGSRAVETFWQQLVLAVGRPAHPLHLRFVYPARQSKLGERVLLRLADSDLAPEVLATSPDGTLTRLEVRKAPDADAPWNADWKPDKGGLWKLTANVEGDLPAFAFASVVTESAGESARTLPAIETMRDLAMATGGSLITRDPPSIWQAPATEKAPEPLAHEDRRLLWNTWPILCLALGFFALELTLRRFWKLV